MKAMIQTAAAGVVALAAGAAMAQTSPLYTVPYGGNSGSVVQGGNVISSWTLNGSNYETGIAVSGDIRTVNAFPGNGIGQRYDLSGTPIGSTVQNNSLGSIYDGATDGVKFNYAVEHNGSYNVFQFDRDWGNPTPMFNVGFACSGITYDNGTLWIADALNSRTVRQFDLNGNELFRFDAAQSDVAYGLALDPADQTLWVGTYYNNKMTQYKKDGTYLQTVFVNGLGGAMGMEFDMTGIPAPGAAALLGVGGLVAARRRRA